MEKIKIPNFADRFTSAEGNYHVSFPFDREDEFHQWCETNNIGWEQNNRPDVIKSDCQVFCTVLNARDIFEI